MFWWELSTWQVRLENALSNFRWHPLHPCLKNNPHSVVAPCRFLLQLLPSADLKQNFIFFPQILIAPNIQKNNRTNIWGPKTITPKESWKILHPATKEKLLKRWLYNPFLRTRLVLVVHYMRTFLPLFVHHSCSTGLDLEGFAIPLPNVLEMYYKWSEVINCRKDNWLWVGMIKCDFRRFVWAFIDGI